MRTPSDPSDVTDEPWSRIAPHIPVYPGGRPRTTALRDVVDAVFYVRRTGCPWRSPPNDVPPESTVWRYFDPWRHNGTPDAIPDALRRRVRAAEEPHAPRTTARVDRPSVGTTSGGEHRGRDNAENVDGRKRHIVVDGLGLRPAVLVTAATADDGAAAVERFARRGGPPVSQVRRTFADRTYHNYALSEWVEGNADGELVIVRRPEGQTGWVKRPLRWAVERTFAWLGRCRRLSTDREKTVRSSEAFVQRAMIHLVVNRLEPRHSDAKFGSRVAA